jgi:hypothetical protein
MKREKKTRNKLLEKRRRIIWVSIQLVCIDTKPWTIKVDTNVSYISQEK